MSVCVCACGTWIHPPVRCVQDQRRGMDGPILLIPELCHMTGLTDEMRSDFRVMKDLAVHTRVGPKERIETMQKFVAQINS